MFCEFGNKPPVAANPILFGAITIADYVPKKTLSFKRIDQFKAAILEILDLSGGNGKPVGVGNTCNLSVR